MYYTTCCGELEGSIAEYLDDVLHPDLRHRFEQHLLLCAACHDALARTRWTIRCLGELPRERMPATMKSRILRTARRTLPAPPTSPPAERASSADPTVEPAAAPVAGEMMETTQCVRRARAGRTHSGFSTS